MKTMRRHYLFMTFMMTLCVTACWIVSTDRNVRADVDVLWDGKNTTTIYQLTGGDHVIVLDNEKHNIFVYARNSDNSMHFMGVRNYSYDLMLDEYPFRDGSKPLPDTSVGTLASIAKSKIEEDKDWIDHKKTLKGLTKRQMDKELSAFTKKKVKSSRDKTAVLSLQGSTSQTNSMFLLMDGANNRFLLYEINKSGSAPVCQLMSARNVEHDFEIPAVKDTADVVFPSNLPVTAIKKWVEDAKEDAKKAEKAGDADSEVKKP